MYGRLEPVSKRAVQIGQVTYAQAQAYCIQNGQLGYFQSRSRSEPRDDVKARVAKVNVWRRCAGGAAMSCFLLWWELQRAKANANVKGNGK